AEHLWVKRREECRRQFAGENLICAGRLLQARGDDARNVEMLGAPRQGVLREVDETKVDTATKGLIQGLQCGAKLGNGAIEKINHAAAGVAQECTNVTVAGKIENDVLQSK